MESNFPGIPLDEILTVGLGFPVYETQILLPFPRGLLWGLNEVIHSVSIIIVT